VRNLDTEELSEVITIATYPVIEVAKGMSPYAATPSVVIKYGTRIRPIAIFIIKYAILLIRFRESCFFRLLVVFGKFVSDFIIKNSTINIALQLNISNKPNDTVL